MKNKEYIKIYADFLKSFLKPRRRTDAIFDCSNGAAGPILRKLKVKNLKFKVINEKPDGNFSGHGPNPLEKGSLNDLCSAVKKDKADLGVIFDADADRVFFVDNLGRFVNPDIAARLLIWHLSPKKIIIDIRTGWLIKKIKNQKSKIIISKVGHYFIKKLMREIKADFAAEYSGHYYFKNFFYADSGILAAIETINAVSKLPYKLSNFIDLLPQYYRSGELNFKIADKEGLMKFIEKKYGEETKFTKLDGLTAEFSDWWFNFRPSNTEPLVRLNIEAQSKKLLNQKIKELKKIIVSF